MWAIDYSQVIVAFGVFCAGCALGMFGGPAVKAPPSGQGLKFHGPLKGFSVGRSSRPIFHGLMAILLNSVIGLIFGFVGIWLITVLRLTNFDLLSSADRLLPFIFIMIVGMSTGRLVQEQFRRRI